MNFEPLIRYVCAKTDCSNSTIDLVALWTFALVVATLLLVFVTVLLWRVSSKQLGGISKTTKADFIERFSSKFFNHETRIILMLFDYKALSFQCVNIVYEAGNETGVFPYFLIDEKIVRQFKVDESLLNNLLSKKVYSAFEVDDLLLGYFEDIGAFHKQGLLDITDIYNYFDWYIETCWENSEIQKYVTQQRAAEGNDIYENFEHIHNRCLKHASSNAKRQKLLTYIKYMFP